MRWETKAVAKRGHREKDGTLVIDETQTVEELRVPDGPEPLIVLRVVTSDGKFIVESSHGAPHGSPKFDPPGDTSAMVPPFADAATAKEHALRFALALVEESISKLHQLILQPAAGGSTRSVGLVTMKSREDMAPQMKRLRETRKLLEGDAP